LKIDEFKIYDLAEDLNGVWFGFGFLGLG